MDRGSSNNSDIDFCNRRTAVCEVYQGVIPFPIKAGGSLSLGRDSIRDSKARVRARHSSGGRDSMEVMKLQTAASSIMLPFSSWTLIDEPCVTDLDLDRALAFAGDWDRDDPLPLYILLQNRMKTC